jgi:hypothetical protein
MKLATELADGIVVSHALLDAPSLPIPRRVQGLVCKPAHRVGGGGTSRRPRAGETPPRRTATVCDAVRAMVISAIMRNICTNVGVAVASKRTWQNRCLRSTSTLSLASSRAVNGKAIISFRRATLNRTIAADSCTKTSCPAHPHAPPCLEAT